MEHEKCRDNHTTVHVEYQDNRVMELVEYPIDVQENWVRIELKKKKGHSYFVQVELQDDRSQRRNYYRTISTYSSTSAAGLGGTT